jgi:hypothetical protein
MLAATTNQLSHCKCFDRKNYGFKNCGVPAGKICTIYGKGLKELQGNPVIIAGPVIITGFPRNSYSPFP